MKKIVALVLACALLASLAACSQQAAPSAGEASSAPASQAPASQEPASSDAPASQSAPASDAVTSATVVPQDVEGKPVDAVTSASIVPEALRQHVAPKGFTDGDAKKALFVIGDPRYMSVTYDLANTAMAHFEEKGVEVAVRDLYAIGFNPVLSAQDFYYAKDGLGEAPAEIKAEQDFVSKADYIIFVYPNWHDTPNAIVKGYMEKVFAKKYAYQSNADGGLEGLLKGKSIYTIMNAGYLGGGRGYIGDGVGIEDQKWDMYMNAFKVFDDDTAAFWGVENKGRFVNDRTPGNSSEKYEEEIKALRESLIQNLDKTFLG